MIRFLCGVAVGLWIAFQFPNVHDSLDELFYDARSVTSEFIAPRERIVIPWED